MTFGRRRYREVFQPGWVKMYPSNDFKRVPRRRPAKRVHRTTSRVGTRQTHIATRTEADGAPRSI